MAEPVLKLENVSKRFGALTANDQVKLELYPGEIHALIGPNGAGKSTLIKQISGELKPDQGTILFGGHPINHLGVAARARAGLGRTFQISSLMPEFSVLQCVMLAVQGALGGTHRLFERFERDRQFRQLAVTQIERLGLHERMNMRVSGLSHGERRHLELAMALALSPKALLLDEPLAGVDPGGTQEITGLLGDLKNAAPILLVEHDMAAVFELADRISVMVYGRIIATGSAHDIRANSEVQQAYLGEEAY